MSKILTANEVCCLSLALIGAFPVTESAPTGESLRRARSFLDLILAEAVGTDRMFSRLDDTLDMPITNGTQEYNLATTIGADYPIDGIEFIVDAWVEDDDGNRHTVEIVQRKKFEDVPDIAEIGTPPCRICIDQPGLDTATKLRIFPTPDAADDTVFTLKLVVQRYAPNVAPLGVSGTPSAGTQHRFAQAWQRWMVFQLAHDLGAGAIHKLPEQNLTRYLGVANDSKRHLLAFKNREHETTPPYTEPWGQ